MVAALSSCTQFDRDFADAKKSEVSLKSELGLDAAVRFRVFSVTNGQRTTVSVHLKAPPTSDPAALKSRVTDVVSRTFRTHVDQVSVDF
jgi:hypothetical protein